ncbi:hypothetical protein ACFTWF_40350 [Rhodococcus sp. NPDC056960]|jgi:hypothetical protein|uniref:hypothetical protein n=1 Tax=Rhodococcus sp. NPDC056960 TaxID=3345982 RepID=UPI00363A5665
MRSQLVRGLGGAAMAVGLACSVVACSSGESSSGTSSTGTGSTVVQDGTAPAAMSDELQACLEENGVPAPPDQAAGGAPGGMAPPSGEMAPPGGGEGSAPPQGGAPDASAAPPGVDSTTWATAQAACSSPATGTTGS